MSGVWRVVVSCVVCDIVRCRVRALFELCCARCGLRCVVPGVWYLVCGAWCVVCCVWCLGVSCVIGVESCVVCAVLCVVRGVLCAVCPDVCELWCVVCGVWCAVCDVGCKMCGVGCLALLAMPHSIYSECLALPVRSEAACMRHSCIVRAALFLGPSSLSQWCETRRGCMLAMGMLSS